VKGGTGTNALALGRPAAGKTGTATNDANETTAAWFTGYTPQVSTSVVYTSGKGNEALSGWLPDAFGSGYPTRTWTDAMKAIVGDLPVENFPPPANVDGDAPDQGHAPQPSTPASTSPSKTPKPSKSASAPASSPPPSESASTNPSQSSEPSTSSEPSSSVTP
jgi:membrane peptidoglycan carboxypeptidase